MIAGTAEEFKKTFKIDHFACPEGETDAAKKRRNKCCTLAWTNPVFYFVSPLCILLFCPCSTVSLSQGQGMDGPQRVLKKTVVPNRGFMSEGFVCVPGIWWRLALHRGRRQCCSTLPGVLKGTNWWARRFACLPDECPAICMNCTHQYDGMGFSALIVYSNTACE